MAAPRSARPPPGLPAVLALNAGSSSIRFAVFDAGAPWRRRHGGKLERIGQAGTRLVWEDAAGATPPPLRLVARDHHAATRALLDGLETHPDFAAIRAVGHRIVHGREHVAPERITPRLLAELRRITPLAPAHLPRELALVEALRQRHPHLAQVACFDTAFHRTLPQVARQFALPRRYAAQGVERYGFHGLSYAYLLEELGRLDPAAARGRVILAHLGSGASLAAVLGGRSLDTTMGFTPAGGLVMGTRCGDLDPGLQAFLTRRGQLTPARFARMVNDESGLLGVSGTSADARDLLAREARDPRAAEALALFCYHAKKGLGAQAAALGGLDTLVFAGGIGEHAPLLRARICAGLGFLGLRLDARRNARGAALISSGASRVAVRVIRTDEEVMLARLTSRVLGLGDPGGAA